jgi:hypothetical protein
VGRLRLACLDDVQLVDPGEAPPASKVRVQIMRRTDAEGCRWKPILAGPPAETRGCGHVVLYTDTPQRLDGRHLPQPGYGMEDIQIAPAARPRLYQPRRPASPSPPSRWVPGIVSVAAVAPSPGRGMLIEPSGRDLGQSVERHAWRLARTPTRCTARAAAGTWVESVRWRPPAFSQLRARAATSRVSTSSRSARAPPPQPADQRASANCMTLTSASHQAGRGSRTRG